MGTVFKTHSPWLNLPYSLFKEKIDKEIGDYTNVTKLTIVISGETDAEMLMATVSWECVGEETHSRIFDVNRGALISIFGVDKINEVKTGYAIAETFLFTNDSTVEFTPEELKAMGNCDD